MSWELMGQITILWCLFILGCTSIIQLSREGLVKTDG